MTVQTAVSTNEYSALQSGAALQLRPDSGVLRMTDADRVDFLQRMTTNDINALSPGQSTVTVLTSSTARVLFAFTVLCQADALWLLPAPDQTAALAKHLRGQIFFMDKVKIEDVSDSYVRQRLMGPQAGEALAALGFGLTGAEDGAFREHGGVLAVKQDAFDVPGYELLVPVSQQEAVLAALENAGALHIDDASYAARRVELGRPAAGHELVEAYTPLEAGLAWTCAENKGCYTGQEIIARQITYDKVTKTLVGLRSDAPLSAGADVTVDGRSVGAVTSTAHSPALDAPVALAVLKKPHNESGTTVDVAGDSATVVELPFV